MGKKKKKTQIAPPTEESPLKIPKCFVIKMGKVSKSIKTLKENLMKVMSPNTSTKLREQRKNVLKDFLHVAGPLGVTHFLIFTQTEVATYLRLAKVPRGPTISFKVLSYSTMADVASSQKKPLTLEKEYLHAPLVVLSGFPSDQDHTKLTSILLQNMFPPLNVQAMKLNECRRVVLFAYNKEEQTISFRHFAITLRALGVSRSVKRILNPLHIPKMGNYEDISDYVLGANYISDSEGEETPESQVEISQRYSGRENQIAPQSSRQSSVRLKEIGPRLELQIVKIQANFCDGAILYHQFVTKTQEEINKQNEKIKKRIKLKEQRRKEQEKNILKKKGAQKEGEQEENPLSDLEEDLEWYRQEVGEEPDPENFKKQPKKRLKEEKEKEDGTSNTNHQEKSQEEVVVVPPPSKKKRKQKNA